MFCTECIPIFSLGRVLDWNLMPLLLTYFTSFLFWSLLSTLLSCALCTAGTFLRKPG